MSSFLKSCCLCLLFGGLAEAAEMDHTLSLFHVKGQVYVIAGSNVNVTVQIGDEAVVFVDTLAPEYVDEMMSLIREVSNSPVRYVISTALDPIHLAGNDAISNLGYRGFGGRGAGVDVAIGGNTSGVTLLAHENVLNRFYLAENDVESLTLTTTYFTPTFDFYMNDEGIAIYHMPNAHTDGDSIIFFRSSDVVSLGDLLVQGQFPDVDIVSGGSVNGFIEALNFTLELMIPGVNAEGGTYVVPGHGRVGDEIDVVEYRNMLVIVRDRIQYQLEQGMGLNQVVASNPTLDYNTEYGGLRGGPSSTEFITAIYQSLLEEME
jgi:glyoxylase-like metal-dependent hydrolase (beta-lactamase superfamily II)